MENDSIDGYCPLSTQYPIKNHKKLISTSIPIHQLYFPSTYTTQGMESLSLPCIPSGNPISLNGFSID